MNYLSKNDKIFVAGHNGMAGSSVVRNLIAKGYENIITENRINLDLLDITQVKKWFKKNNPDVIIICAAKVGGILANQNYPVQFILENLKIQTNLIETAWHNDCKRLIFLGSSCIYPKFSTQPIKEEELLKGSLEITNENYAIAKIAGIKLCSALKKQYGFNAISLMPTNLYGKGDNYHLENSHVVAAMIRRFYEAKLNNAEFVTCWGTGNPLREFLHVDDLGDACVFILENCDIKDKRLDIDYLNVGTGKDISIKELAKKIAFNVGFKGKIWWDKSKPDGTPRKLLDISRMKNLGWSSKIKLDDGLKQTIPDFIECYEKYIK